MGAMALELGCRINQSIAYFKLSCYYITIMTSPGKELERYVSDDEWQRRQEFSMARGLVDFTLIFNQHGSADDAEKSVALIEPNSLVFIEAFNTSSPSLNPQPIFSLLRDLRSEFGIDSNEYREQKKQVIEYISGLEVSIEETEDPLDFSRHILRETRLLIEKDCTIYVADVHTHEGSLISAEVYESIGSMAILTTFGSEDEQLSVGKIIKHGTKTWRDHSIKHELRENMHVGTSVMVAGRHAARGYDTGMARSEDGRLRSYSVFGTAHARSIQDKFQKIGINPSIVILDDIPEGMYLDPFDQIIANKNRAIGYAVVMDLVYSHAGREQIDNEILNELYASLKPLNGDDDAAHKFMIHAAQAMIDYQTGNRFRSFKELKAVLREQIPDNPIGKYREDGIPMSPGTISGTNENAA